MFSTTEPVVREVISEWVNIRYLVLDLKRVLSLDESACRLLYQLVSKCSVTGKAVVFVHADGLPLLRRYLKAKLGQRCEEVYLAFDDEDLALEWCENRLLETALPPRAPGTLARWENYELFEQFTPEEIRAVGKLLKRHTYPRGHTLIEIGDEAEHLFFLASGEVSVIITLESGARKRMATFTAGMAFGELAVIDRAPRSARVIADTEAVCDLLSLAGFETLITSNPAIKIKLLENLSLGLSRKLRKANRERSVLG
jgi:hypothetical protein